MKIARKSEYAFKALVRIAINYQKGIASNLIYDIAERDQIPQKYLEQVLLNLKNSGILVSKRGMGGGYALARPPAEISLGDILRVIEGPILDLNSPGTEKKLSANDITASLQSILAEVRQEVDRVVDNISLETMAKRTSELFEKKSAGQNYII